MIKKLCCLLLCLVFTSCAGKPTTSEPTSSKVAGDERVAAYSVKGKLDFVDAKYGAASESGYYFLEHLSDGSNNVKYIDYNTCVETVLCENPNCAHNDATCNGHNENFNNLPSLIPYSDKLIYAFLGTINSMPQDKSTLPKIEIASLAGSGRQLIASLDDYLYLDPTVAFDNQNLYLLATKMGSDSKSTFKEFIQIDLQTKIASVIYSFKEDEKILFKAVANDEFVFEKIGNPFKGSKPTSSEEWEKLIAQEKHELFYINKYAECKTIKEWTKDQLKSIVINDKMIYIADNQVFSLNLTSGDEVELTSKLEEKLTGYEELQPLMIIDENLLLSSVIVNADGTVRYANLIINLKNSDVFESSLYTKDSANLKNPLSPINQNGDWLLVVNNIKTIKEIVEAADGTKSRQDKMVNEYALISVADYLNNTDNTKAINRIS